MTRIGRNLGGYLGERIDIAQVLVRARQAAATCGWTEQILPARPGVEISVFERTLNGTGPFPLRNVYLSTGIHGDEPAGPLAAVRLLEENVWPAGFRFWLLPCLNPTGFGRNSRENDLGVDLNRDYLHAQAAETQIHIQWLEQQPSFDLAFCLHEDWEANGFYVYELNPDGRPSLAEAMVAAVQAVCPIEQAAVIDGREATAPGIIRPSIDPRSRPLWPEAFYLLHRKTRQSYTLESPSDFPLSLRVEALVTALRAALST